MHKLLGVVALVAAIVTNAPASAVDDATALRTLELEAYRASCSSLLVSMMEATGKRLGAAEALNWVTVCAKQAQAKCDALPRTDGLLEGSSRRILRSTSIVKPLHMRYILRRPRAFWISVVNLVGLAFSMVGVVLLFWYALSEAPPGGPGLLGVSRSGPEWEAECAAITGMLI